MTLQRMEETLQLTALLQETVDCGADNGELMQVSLTEAGLKRFGL